MKNEISELKGWRKDLFDHLLEKGLIKIKNKQLIVTDKFANQIQKKLKRKQGIKRGGK